MKTSPILVAVLVGVIGSGCDLLAPPEPEPSEADRQVEALMREIRLLKQADNSLQETKELQDQLEQARRGTVGADAGISQCDQAAYQALIRELNECTTRLENCKEPRPSRARAGKGKAGRPSQAAASPPDLENPFE